MAAADRNLGPSHTHCIADSALDTVRPVVRVRLRVYARDRVVFGLLGLVQIRIPEIERPSLAPARRDRVELWDGWSVTLSL